MKFHDDIIRLAKENSYFRQVLATGAHSQVVVMSIPPGGDIGEEVHDVDQILVFVAGRGEAVLNGERKPVVENNLVFVPAGTTHNFVNTGSADWKLFTVYAPPEHAPGTVHKTKAEAAAAHE
ncbi:MAG: cupin domain-containing protein [Candidatus Jorgensenbacteria bacterium]